MQSLGWYGRRLRSMSTREIYWRLGSKFAECLDRCAASARQEPPAIEQIAAPGRDACVRRDDAICPGWPEPGSLGALPRAALAWERALRDRAEGILQNRLPLFDLEDCDLGTHIDWNYEHKAGKRAPMRFSPTVDYRDYASTGDCKFVWEPNRHQHLVVLGRAYRLTGDDRYAEKVVQHVESWIEQCPFGLGMNWRSPLELGIRIINWAWAFELIKPSGMVNPSFLRRVMPIVYRHLWEISRKYSRFSSANNHLIGEAAGVFVGSSYFSGLRHASRWQQQSRAILLREILTQTHEDGGTREQATGYHLFVMEFFLLAGLVARRVGVDFPPEYWQRLERMFEYVGALREGGEVPMFGDADDGYVLDAGARASADETLALGAAVFKRPDFVSTGRGAESILWLLGSDACCASHDTGGDNDAVQLSSKALPQSGIYLLQHGPRGAGISVTFDCGELGFGPIAAHGHADALSITLRVAGRDLLVDPGTYDYFTYPTWRTHFRRTRAHNTVEIDGADQSEMLGSFLWGRRADCRCLAWEPTSEGGRVVGEHDGYGALPEPVLHRRTVVLNGPGGELQITDELSGGGTHSALLVLQLAENSAVRREGHAIHVARDGVRADIVLDPSLTVEVLCGSDSPPAGWVSRGYHRKSAAPVILARGTWSGAVRYATRIVVGT